MVVKRWLRAKLISDVTLAGLAPGGVFEYVAPKGTPTPFVVFTPVDAGSDVNVIGAIRVMTQFMYQVTGWITGNDFATLDPIVSRIDELLNGASGTASSGHVLGAVRIGFVDPGPFTDTNDRTSRQMGGEYRLWAQQT